jgi:hypothetical protein
MATRFLKTYILKIKGVAEYLKVTELSIYRLAGAKKIPAFKGVGNWLFFGTDIDRWIPARTATPSAGGHQFERATGRTP